MEILQAGNEGTAYGALLMTEPDSMLYWLAKVTRELREGRERKQVHIAASADVDQSTIWRFESAVGWPRDTDGIIAAYADDLDTTPREIWRRAIELWSGAKASSAADYPKPSGELARRLSNADSNHPDRRPAAKGNHQVEDAREDNAG